MTTQEQIDEIMDDFNFSEVLQYMDSVNWNWVIDGTSKRPTEKDLIKMARRLLNGVNNVGQKEYRHMESGGFHAIRAYDGELKLIFAIESCTSTQL